MRVFYFYRVGVAKHSDSVVWLTNFILGDKNNMQSSSNKKNILDQPFLGNLLYIAIALGHIRNLLVNEPFLEKQAFYLNRRSQPPKLEAEQ